MLLTSAKGFSVYWCGW